MSAYTNISKPAYSGRLTWGQATMSWANATGSWGAVDYIYVNTTGRQTYDEPLLAYDDSTTFYDGVDMSAWTSVAKPTGTGSSIMAGYSKGLLIPLTVSSVVTISDTSWIMINKPIT